MAFKTTARRRDSVVTLLVFLSCFSLFVAISSADVLIGVFNPSQGRSMTQSLAMDKWQGKTNAIQTIFTTFDESEMSWLWPALENTWAGHKIPLLTWEPKYWAKYSPLDIETQVADGKLDSYLITWGRGLKNFIAGPDGVVGTGDDRRVYFRFAHEMNGNWYPWSASKGQTTPADYVRMWKHVYNLFDSDSIGLPRSKVASSFLWVWSPINFDVGDFKMDDYYPGDDFVDWKGLTGFNWGTSESWSGWWNPQRLFEDAIDRIRKIGSSSKPLAITEYSSVPDGGDKSGWITQFFELVLRKDIRMACYFNLDKQEQSAMKYWSIFGSGGDETYWDKASNQNYKGWSSYRRAIANPSILGADLNNPRVITDRQFLGFVSETNTPDPVDPVDPVDPDPVDPVDPVDPTSTPSPTAKPNTSTPKPTSAPGKSRHLHVFSDSTVDNYDLFSWGETKSSANPKFNPETLATLSDELKPAPEGKTCLRVRSTQGWIGCGLFSKQGTVDLTPYKRIKFQLANTETVKIEIEDVTGKKWMKLVAGTSSLAWRTVSLAITTPSRTGVVIDFSKVKGLLLATSNVATEFFIDNVYYEK